MSILVLNVAGLAFNAGFPTEARAQQSRSIHVAFNYEYFRQDAGTTESWTYIGSADLTPVDGGYEGSGTGTYQGLDELPPYPPCSQPQRTTYTGTAGLTVNAQYSIDNSVTGGPDTSMYNSTTSVIELLVYGENIAAAGTGIWDGSQGCKSENWTINVGFDCHFYGIDFSVGGTYAKQDEDAPDYSKCSITITPMDQSLHIFGTVKGLFGAGGAEGMSNSRVLIARLDEETHIKKLSASKPDFFSKTSTSDNATANYEFTFGRGGGKLPVILVVSLLWYEGKPEFAITNGKETDRRLIPVYQALCVDDNPSTKCDKWKETADGYEAEVNFEYGSGDKLVENWQVMDTEEWMGLNPQYRGGSVATNAPTEAAVPGVMADSAYMYYNSYRAMKYIETLGLQSTLKPLAIRSHDFDPNCGNGTAWYEGKLNDPSFRRSFGDMGTFADRVDADSEVVMCDAGSHSSLYYYRAPNLPLWHEIGHYLQFQMYNANGAPRGTPHDGYQNPGTNDSVIEGFAGFFSMLVHEYYGLGDPQIYNSVDVELDVKIWGPDLDEEEAVAGILWDFHDGGIEINRGHFMNATVSGGSYVGGTLTQVSRVYPQSSDEVSLTAPVIMRVIERNQVRTLADLYNAFVSERRIGSIDMDMIYVNHGAFADVEQRNFVHDSAGEKIGESGSKSSPVRLTRTTPPPEIPGSYIVADADSTFNFTVRLGSPYEDHVYSYLRETKAGEKMSFRMPPAYYPSTLTITALSADGKPLKDIADIDSNEYWAYIDSKPPQDGVFRSISIDEGSGEGGSITAVHYIQNVRYLLNKVSEEYRSGNATGAEKLATAAYLDNFEYVESDLEQRNATELKEQVEQLMRVELIGLVKGGADSQVVDDKITEINDKLDEAIVIVPEFPQGMALLVLAIVTASAMAGVSGHRGRSHPRF